MEKTFFARCFSFFPFWESTTLVVSVFYKNVVIYPVLKGWGVVDGNDSNPDDLFILVGLSGFL